MSLFLKEKQFFCPLKKHKFDQKYSVDIVNVVNDYCISKRLISNGIMAMQIVYVAIWLAVQESYDLGVEAI
jgi:hypothetical protein